MKAFLTKLGTLDPVTRTRVWVTLSALLLGVFAATGSWWLIRSAPLILPTDQYGLPMIAIVFSITALCLFLRPSWVEIAQLLGFSVCALFVLLDFQSSSLQSLKDNNTMAAGMPWFPVVSVLAFLVLLPQQALWFSIFFNLIAIGLSVLTLTNATDSQVNILIQFHVANMVLMGFIAIFGRMRAQYNTVQLQANTDVLTGIQNRRSMQQHLEQTHADQLPYALIVLDVDRFKNINDHYGHAFGDIVLREMAFVLENHTRQGDQAARWGGEEFLVLVKNQSLEQTCVLAERLRKAIVEANLGGVRITASLGVAARQETENLDEVMARADAALYQAKANGRDRVSSMVMGYGL